MNSITSGIDSSYSQINSQDTSNDNEHNNNEPVSADSSGVSLQYSATNFDSRGDFDNDESVLNREHETSCASLSHLFRLSENTGNT